MCSSMPPDLDVEPEGLIKVRCQHHKAEIKASCQILQTAHVCSPFQTHPREARTAAVCTRRSANYDNCSITCAHDPPYLTSTCASVATKPCAPTCAPDLDMECHAQWGNLRRTQSEWLAPRGLRSRLRVATRLPPRNAWPRISSTAQIKRKSFEL
jgi:hypothetical protein